MEERVGAGSSFATIRVYMPTISIINQRLETAYAVCAEEVSVAIAEHGVMTEVGVLETYVLKVVGSDRRWWIPATCTQTIVSFCRSTHTHTRTRTHTALSEMHNFLVSADVSQTALSLAKQCKFVC